MSARRRIRKLSSSDEDADSTPSSQPQSQSQSQSPSFQSQSQSQNHRHCREPHDDNDADETVSELQSQYMFDEGIIDAAKRSRNLRQQLYGGLIQNVQGFQDRDGTGGFDLRTVLTENTLKGQQLGSIRTVHTSDMYNAFQHTNICTKMLRFHSERVGDAKNFKANDYITALKCMGDRLQHSLASIFAKSTAIGGTSYNLIGTFDRQPTVPKDEKKPAPKTVVRRKRNFDERLGEATQYEEGEDGGASGSRHGGRGGGKDGAPSSEAEQLSNKVFQSLKRKSRARAKPFNVYEFALSKESMADTIQNLFYTGFLIRDAWASLTAAESSPSVASQQMQSQGSGSSSYGSSVKGCDLILKPDRPPKKGPGGDAGRAGSDGALRHQYILSFSPKLYRELRAAAKGETEISELDENDNHGGDVKAEEIRSRSKHFSKTPSKTSKNSQK